MYQAVNNGTWQHVCTTWENAAGSWSFYIDGSLLAKGDNLKTGHVINNTGIFILGQDQDSQSIFSFSNHFVNSAHNLFSCLYTDIVSRNLMLALLGLKGLSSMHRF